MISHELDNLQSILKSLNIDDPENKIAEALMYFQSRYRELPNKYPGDKELYLLFKRCILSGLSLDNSFKTTKQVIDREIYLCQWGNQMGLGYAERFFP